MHAIKVMLLAGLLFAASLAHAGEQTQWRDLAYGQAPAQRLDVYAPSGAHHAPVIVMVHGGAWMIGDKSNPGVTGSKLAHWSAAGYVFVSVDYRMLPADPLQQAGDIAAALAYVQQHAVQWGGDGRRVVLMGHSAGAHLVALLAADPTLARSQGAHAWLGTVALDSAAYDIPRIMQAPHPAFYDRAFGADPAFWRQVSPRDRLRAGGAPMLLVCSSQRLMSCSQADAFAAAVRSKGGRVQVSSQALSHKQINAELGEDSAYTRAVDQFLRSLGLP
ncbi:alpha/beta hydrolase [Dyella sp.]|uniref:alpha/beta hydrolase n=1 Tax=Dyella sp. TaxID=1869338 RepID=UPI002ED236BF